ncbi:TPA: hypothetical protein U2E34_001440 [Streptococcus suis]|uniref:hypothetical protein n=1 Tax=Streptococcus suis TaxID=1307 RepID=UPI002A76B414|nr:hypothetical protein [Streptococcus suis]HEM5106692.1 hypothetical protein [Streptococcus suis]HEM5110763.1 hypothetical protein [Streptococcus suis]HEM5200877.1 hypothetical protein [Streptococcus suis]HEM5928051.1 hypothetical protein [Streptococcus suis]
MRYIHARSQISSADERYGNKNVATVSLDVQRLQPLHTNIMWFVNQTGGIIMLQYIFDINLQLTLTTDLNFLLGA